jgi:hypothetical protein
VPRPTRGRVARGCEPELRTSCCSVPAWNEKGQHHDQLSYKDAELDLSIEGDEITCVETSLGRLVTVTLENVVDAFTRTFTLVAPSIRLTHGGETKFDNWELRPCTEWSAFVPSPGASGALQTYRVYQVHGIAQQVEF